MESYFVAKEYALLALNGEETGKEALVSKLKNRCVAAAVLMEDILQKSVWEKRETVTELVHKVKELPQKECNKIAENFIDGLKTDGLLEEIPSLLECDLNYDTAGIRIRQYRIKASEYKQAVEYIRKEVLEDREVSIEGAMVVWLLGESGDLERVFSTVETETVKEKITELKEGYRGEFIDELFDCSLGKEGIRLWKKFLETKKEMAQKPVGLGVVSRLPMLERSESIFIATDRMFPGDKERLEDTVRQLTEKGHVCDIKSVGKVSEVEIDNVLYELIPDAVSVRFINVHGVRLRRKY